MNILMMILFSLVSSSESLQVINSNGISYTLSENEFHLLKRDKYSILQIPTEIGELTLPMYGGRAAVLARMKLSDDVVKYKIKGATVVDLTFDIKGKIKKIDIIKKLPIGVTKSFINSLKLMNIEPAKLNDIPIVFKERFYCFIDTNRFFKFTVDRQKELE